MAKTFGKAPAESIGWVRMVRHARYLRQHHRRPPG
jgi:hypothetical protein